MYVWTFGGGGAVAGHSSLIYLFQDESGLKTVLGGGGVWSFCFRTKKPGFNSIWDPSTDIYRLVSRSANSLLSSWRILGCMPSGSDLSIFNFPNRFRISFLFASIWLSYSASHPENRGIPMLHTFHSESKSKKVIEVLCLYPIFL